MLWRIMTVSFFLATAIVSHAPHANADILLPGHKSVKHELVFEDSDLFQEHRLIAAPIAGFSGVEEIKPGKPFSFSSKYGTKFYLVPRAAELPGFDKEAFQQWPHASPPVSEIKSVPASSPVVSATTTLRFASVHEGQPVIEKVAHVELDRFGNRASKTRSMLGFSLLMAGGLVLCLIAIRRMKASSRSAEQARAADESVSESK